MQPLRVRHQATQAMPAATYFGGARQAKPLTHHEIMTLIAPFTERGLQMDMDASRREERRVVFKPSEHPPSTDFPGNLQAQLCLQAATQGRHELMRTVTDDSGLTATATVMGKDIGRLLEALDALPVERHFRVYSGYPVARSYEIDVVNGSSERRLARSDNKPATDSKPVRRQPILVGARARVEGVQLELKAVRLDGPLAEIRLTTDPGIKLQMPEDLLAVLGWRWRPCQDFGSYWRGNLRVAAREPKRTEDLETQLATTVTHFAETLAQPPQAFHARHRRARWRVSLQRSIPLLIGLLLLALAPSIQWQQLEEGSVMKLLVFLAPPLMMVGAFTLRETPRIEIPPIPRPLKQTAWLVTKQRR